MRLEKPLRSAKSRRWAFSRWGQISFSTPIYFGCGQVTSWPIVTKIKEEMDMATLRSMLRRPVPAGTAAASGLAGLLFGVTIALIVTAGVPSRPASLHPSSAGGVPAYKSELITHGRSEEGLGRASAGGEQIAHNRSEKGLGKQ